MIYYPIPFILIQPNQAIGVGNFVGNSLYQQIRYQQISLGALYMALSDTFIRAIKATNKPQKMTDGGGLFLFVSPLGGKW